jgi:hypothetical protein
MRPRSSRCLSAALAAFIVLPAAAQAQINPFRGGPGLSPEDNRMLLDSIERLNAAEPAKAGRSEAWSNPQTNTPGVPLGWHGLPSGAQSHRRRRTATGSRLPAHLVPHAERRVEDQGLTGKSASTTHLIPAPLATPVSPPAA